MSCPAMTDPFGKVKSAFASPAAVFAVIESMNTSLIHTDAANAARRAAKSTPERMVPTREIHACSAVDAEIGRRLSTGSIEVPAPEDIVLAATCV